MNPLKLNASMFMKPRHLPPSAWIGHIPFAGWIVEELKPASFVELGTHNGASYLAFCQAIQENGLPSKCFAVDTWQGDEQTGSYDDSVFETLRAVHDGPYAGFSQLMRMTFDDALSYFEDGSIDLLHIDGLHTYAAVSHDLETWLPKLSDRGVILFHDTMVREREFGVWKLWSELSKRYPSFEFHHSYGLGVLLVGTILPPSLMALAQVDSAAETLALRLFDSMATSIENFAQNEMLVAKRLAREETQRQLHADMEQQLEQRLATAQAQIADANVQLGRADAFARTQAGENSQVLKVVAERDQLIEFTNGKLADCRAELAVAEQALRTADQNARAHVAESRLVARDIEDLQRQAAAHRDVATQAQGQLETCRAELAEAGEQGKAQSARVGQLGLQLDAAKSQVAALEARVAELEESLRQSQAELHALSDSHDAVLNSRRWRWSAPLRWLGEQGQEPARK